MVQVKYVCDKCEKEMSQCNTVEISVSPTNGMFSARAIQLCDDCYNDIVSHNLINTFLTDLNPNIEPIIFYEDTPVFTDDMNDMESNIDEDIE